jgi:Leucine rich repeat
MPTSLNLWKQKLGAVPESVWDQIDLQKLILAENDLIEVSERIAGLRSLRTLDLGHNLLTNVPQALGDLEGLSDFLYLHDNRLTSLPESLGRLGRLRYLNISENAFKMLPECICNMKGLIELRLSDNHLTELPETIGQLSELRELHLRNNELRSLPNARRQPRATKLDSYKHYIDELVKAAAPDWIPAAVLFGELKRLGYSGGLTTLKLYLAKVKPRAEAEPLIRFEAEPGRRCRPISPRFGAVLIAYRCSSRHSDGAGRRSDGARESGAKTGLAAGADWI